MVDLTFPFPPHLQVEVEEPVAEVEEESAADIKVRICAARERALAKPGDRGVAFPEAFPSPRLHAEALCSCLTFVPPRPHAQIETAPFDPRFPQMNQAKHCYTRYNEFHKCVPFTPRPSTPARPQITWLLLVAGPPLTNIFPSAPLPFSPSSQVQSAEGRGRRRVREVRQVLPLFVPY